MQDVAGDVLILLYTWHIYCLGGQVPPTMSCESTPCVYADKGYYSFQKLQHILQCDFRLWGLFWKECIRQISWALRSTKTQNDHLASHF